MSTENEPAAGNGRANRHVPAKPVAGDQVSIKLGAREVNASVVRQQQATPRRKFLLTIPTGTGAEPIGWPELQRPGSAAPTATDRAETVVRQQPAGADEHSESTSDARVIEAARVAISQEQAPPDVPLFSELAQREVAPPPPPQSEPAEPTARRRWPLVVAFSAFALSVAIPVTVKLHSSDSADTAATGRQPDSPAPAAAQPSAAPTESAVARSRAQLVAYARANLGMDATLVSDADTVSQLRAAGFSSARSFDQLSAVPLQTIDYVLNVAGSSAPAAQRSRLLATSLPLAEFDAGSTVREVFPKGVSAQLGARTEDAELRSEGGRELAANPGIVADAATKKLLPAGRLDLRAQSVLNVLATSGTIYLSDPVAVPAEQRVGLPVRSIVVTTDDPQGLQDSLTSLTAPYRPASTVTISQRKVRLSWLPAIAPVATGQ